MDKKKEHLQSANTLLRWIMCPYYHCLSGEECHRHTIIIWPILAWSCLSLGHLAGQIMHAAKTMFSRK